MEKYLPFIKALLSEWYLFTLNNPLYAAALATAVWLLTAMLYSIRIAAIKRGQVASEKAGIKSLNAAQQQLQHTQEELAATVVQMEKAQGAVQDETQRALALEQLIYQRNQQIAGTIQSLATSIDLGERPLLASEDVKADSLWQQHDKVITQLIDRLRTEQQAKVELQQTFQAETAKLAEKESLLEALQPILASHTNQLSKLEQALDEQKAILQQQNDAQQAISASLKTYQPAVSRPVESEPEAFRAVRTWQQPIPQEASPAIAEPLIAQAAENHKIEPIITEEPPIATRWQNEVEPIIEAPQAATRWQDEQAPRAIEPTFEAATPYVAPQQLDEEMPSESSDSEQQPAPAKGSFGKIKNLFGKPKQQPVNPEKGSIGKIKNLFGKLKK
ncbi:MAG: hypothetical protein Q8L15_12375 [Methylobacter sp.]|nr:hypothetical protein [Methylobacter sp.]